MTHPEPQLTAQSTAGSWPRTSTGTIDWEVVFEHPTMGFIPLVESARTPVAMRKVTQVIIGLLFARAEDAERRRAFEAILGEIAANPDFTQTTSNIAVLLRRVKDDRLRRSAEASQDGTATAESRVAEPVLEAAGDTGAKAPAAGPPEAEPQSIRDLFSEAFRSLVRERYRVLQKDLDTENQPIETLPFMFSPVFLHRLEDLIHEEFVDDLMVHARSLVIRAENEPPANRRDYLRQAMNSKEYRAVLWESWQMVWKEKTLQKELPEKPAPEKKGLLAGLRKKKPANAWEDEPMSLEDWEFEVDRITAANQQAKVNWAGLIADHPDYQAPSGADNNFLLAFFGRNPETLEKQITAIHQIVRTSDNAARGFDTYKGNKDLDLALLTVALRHPQTYLDEELKLLRSLVGGYGRKNLASAVPYVARYLGDFVS